MQEFRVSIPGESKGATIIGEDLADAIRLNIWNVTYSLNLKRITDVKATLEKYPTTIRVEYIGHYNNYNDGREEFCKNLSFKVYAKDGTRPEDILPEEIYFEEISRVSRQERWQAKVGLIGKTYKLHKDIVDDFAAACKKNDISLSQQLETMMKNFIKETNTK